MEDKIKEIAKVLKDKSKETAENIFKKVRELIQECNVVIDERYEPYETGYLRKNVDDGIKELAKQFGVEVDG